MCHDPSVVATTAVDVGAGIATVNNGGPPDFVEIQIFPNGWFIGSVLSIFGSAVLPPGGPYALTEVTYNAAGPIGATTALFDCPLSANGLVSVIVIGGASIPPIVSGSLEIGIPTTQYRRGDFNEDGGVNIADAIQIANYLFIGGTDSNCPQSGDTKRRSLTRHRRCHLTPPGPLRDVHDPGALPWLRPRGSFEPDLLRQLCGGVPLAGCWKKCFRIERSRFRALLPPAKCCRTGRTSSLAGGAGRRKLGLSIGMTFSMGCWAGSSE